MNDDALNYKLKASQFDLTDFGLPIEMSFNCHKPEIKPDVGRHPRVMVSSCDIEKLKTGIHAKENEYFFKQFVELSDRDTDGKLLVYNRKGSNADHTVLASIEAKAFRYLMTGEKSYGYNALYAAKNALITIDAEKMADPYRDYGVLMYVLACVYDWCYDLLDSNDKAQLTRGAINKLGSRMEIGWPPCAKGNISHHTVECQLFKSYLSFGIAVYDEYPLIYDYTACRLFDEIVPAQNFMLNSGRHWEGSGYGPIRTYYLMWGQCLISAMTNGKKQLFDCDSLHRTSLNFLQFLYPGRLEGHPTFEIGDQCDQYLTNYYFLEFFAGNYFKDPILKGFVQKEYFENKSHFISGYYGYASITPVTYLIVNDILVPSSDWRTGLKTVEITDYPGSSVFARGSWTDKDTPAVYMNMNEYYSSSHSHMDTGSFQIFYKGILVSDSGIYDGYGTEHHYGYTVQTVSGNSVLVYNSRDAEKLELKEPYHPYSGGQSLVSDYSRFICSFNLEDARKCSSMNQCTVIGKSSETCGGSCRYAYIAGDMTEAYDAVTVDEVTRYMLSVMTGNEEYPMLFVTYDRVTAKDEKYKKTVLLHSKQQPEYKDGFVIITNTKGGNSGKLIAQSLITDMNADILGGNGTEYTVNGKPIVPNGYSSSKTEYRIDMCPSKAAKTDYMLTCMYVTDSGNTAEPVKAKEINTKDFAGAVIFNRALIFAREKGELQGKYEFTAEGNGQIDYYIAGVKPGNWDVTVNGKKISTRAENGEGLLKFTADAGKVTLNFKG